MAITEDTHKKYTVAGPFKSEEWDKEVDPVTGKITYTSKVDTAIAKFQHTATWTQDHPDMKTGSKVVLDPGKQTADITKVVQV